MNDEQLKHEDYANYSRLLHVQFIKWARWEVISDIAALDLFFNRFVELYGEPLGGRDVMGGILNGEMVLPSTICVSVCKKYCHCPLIGVFNSLIQGGLMPELVEASNKVVSRALIS